MFFILVTGKTSILSLSDSDRILSSLADNLFLLTVRFSFLYNLYSVFSLITWDYAKRPLYCYVCMECFQGSYCFEARNYVACRKRVQRYAKFLNYQTFYRENFKEFYSKNNKRLNDNHLNEKNF